MTYVVIHDPDLGLAVLVDPAGPHALGPAIGGEAADRILESFVSGLDQDPTELTAFELAAMWAQFLAVLGYSEETDPTAGAPGAAEPQFGAGDPLDGIGEPAAQAPAGEGTAVLEAGRDEAPQPAGEWPACSNCGSTKREAHPDGSATCAVCGEPVGAGA